MIVILRKKMRIIILLSSITLITAYKVDAPPRSVNVDLETSILFDPKDLHQGRYNFRHFNIREFLDKLLIVIDPQKPRSRFRGQGKRRDTKQELEERTDSIEKLEKRTDTGTSIKNVLDFVKNVGQTFVNLTGNKMSELTKPKYKGPTAIPEKAKLDKQGKHGKEDIKAIISDSTNYLMRRYPEEMRTIMNTVNGINPLLNTVARRTNNDDDVKKLMKLMKKFERHIENNHDTSKIVKELQNNHVFNEFYTLTKTMFILYMWHVGNIPITFEGTVEDSINLKEFTYTDSDLFKLIIFNRFNLRMSSPERQKY